MDVGIKAVVSGFEEAKRQIGGVGDALDKVKDSAKETSAASGSGSGGLSASFDSLAGAGKLAAGAIGVGLVAALGYAAAKIKDAVTDTITLGDRLNNLSQITGMSVEKLGGLKLAAEVSGSSLESLSTGIGRFNQNFDQAQKGIGAASDAFKRLGIDVKSLSEEQAFDLFVQKISEMKDGAGKVAIGNEIMGHGFRELIPLFNQGAAGLAKISQEARQAGIVMSTETAEAANKLNANMAVLKAYGQGFWAEIASPIVEALAKITSAMRDARNEGAGFLATMGAGIKRGAADLLFGTPEDALAKNKTNERRLIASINAKEAQKSGPGFQSNAVFEQTLQAEYLALQDIYAEQGRLQDAVDIQSPNFFTGGRQGDAPPRSSTGRAGRAGKSEDDRLADVQNRMARQTGEGWAAYYKEREREDAAMGLAVEKREEYTANVSRKMSDQTAASWKIYYSDREKEDQALEKGAIAGAERELQAIRNTVYASRDDRVAAIEAVKVKYNAFEGAVEKVNKELAHTKTEAQWFSEELAKIFSYSIPNAILKTVGTIQGDLSTAIYNIFSGTKSMGDSIKGFFSAIGTSILKMLADIAAHQVMQWIFGTGGVMPLPSLLSLGASGATSVLGSGITAGSGTALPISSALGLGKGTGSAPVVEAVITPVAGGAGVTIVGDGVADAFGGYGVVAGEGGSGTTGATTAAASAATGGGVITAGGGVADAFGGYGAVASTSTGASPALAGLGWVAAPVAIAGLIYGSRNEGRRPSDSDEVMAEAKADFFSKNPWASESDWNSYLNTDQGQGIYAPGHPNTSAILTFSDSGNFSTWETAHSLRNQSPTASYASGTDMIVSRPTVFTAGESGSERVTVTPLAGSYKSRSGLNVTFNGPAMFDEYTFRRFQRMILDNG